MKINSIYLSQTAIWMQRDTVAPSIKSAGDKIKRGQNSGQQQFDANTDTWPLGQAIPKVESFIQVSGMTEMHMF